MSDTYTDRSGHTITRDEAIRMAVDCIIRQGEERPIVQEHVAFLTDDELMEWLVYPDTGDFPDEALRCRHRSACLGHG